MKFRESNHNCKSDNKEGAILKKNGSRDVPYICPELGNERVILAFTEILRFGVHHWEMPMKNRKELYNND